MASWRAVILIFLARSLLYQSHVRGLEVVLITCQHLQVLTVVAQWVAAQEITVPILSHVVHLNFVFVPMNHPGAFKNFRHIRDSRYLGC